MDSDTNNKDREKKGGRQRQTDRQTEGQHVL